MTDWRDLYDKRDWDAVEDWWRSDDDREGAAELLHRLQADVPRLTRRNGMEEHEDHMHPHEAPDEWKGGADILYLGELEAWVEGTPEPVPLVWSRERAGVETLLREFIGAGEVTQGDATLSRASHACEALDRLSNIDFCTALMCDEIDPDGNLPDDREWLREFAEEIAALAFRAGIETRAALGKAAETHALRGKKLIAAASHGGHERVQNMRAVTTQIINFMQSKIKDGVPVSLAASFAAKAALGSSREANRKLWTRFQRK